MMEPEQGAQTCILDRYGDDSIGENCEDRNRCFKVFTGVFTCRFAAWDKGKSPMEVKSVKSLE